MWIYLGIIIFYDFPDAISFYIVCFIDNIIGDLYWTKNRVNTEKEYNFTRSFNCQENSDYGGKGSLL